MKRILFLLLSVFPVIFANGQNWKKLKGGLNGVPNVLFGDTIDNFLYAGGKFNKADTSISVGITKWDGDNFSRLGCGVDWDCITNLCPNCFPQNVWTIARYNNELYIGGAFSKAGNISAKYIAKWDGSKWDSLNSTVNNITLRLIPCPLFSGNLCACGDFTLAGSTSASNVARMNIMNSWLAFGGTIWSGGGISSMAIYNGDLYVGGNMWSGSMSKISRWNGFSWQPVGSGILGNPAYINDMIVYNNELYVTGYFKQSDGNPGNYVQKWNGTTWSDVGGGLDDYAWDLEVHNGKLYAGGVFQNAGNITAKYIAVWDGNKWCGLGSNFDNVITCLSFYKDTLYIGGAFKVIDTDSISHIAKWVGGNYIDTCSTVGISEISNSNYISVYPNPSQGRFSIEAKGDLAIYNVLGEKIYTEKLVSEKTEIDLADKPKGIYFYQITAEEKNIVTGKLVVQ